ncbi:acyl-CoA dehydrogenase C-terminal domain-containing protein, partial [Pseudomonas sp. MWU12-2115]|uniref:acyl-CoA dehydrogenase C-terminal domain-containing protein n=1 Tax=Pseudomonas sp. MWU12-2115 TaxID=2071713 RepID=UPI001C49ACB9
NEGNDKLAEYIAPLARLMKDVGEVTMGIGMASLQNKDEAGAAATDYLRLIGHLSYAWLWARMAEVAHASLGQGEDAF